MARKVSHKVISILRRRSGGVKNIFISVLVPYIPRDGRYREALRHVNYVIRIYNYDQAAVSNINARNKTLDTTRNPLSRKRLHGCLDINDSVLL